MQHYSTTTLHRHHIHGETASPEKNIYIQHPTHHIHGVGNCSEPQNPLDVKRCAAELTSQINSSRKIVRDMKDPALRRTHLQLLKERLSSLHRLISKNKFLKVPAESLMMVEQEIFEAEKELNLQVKPDAQKNPQVLIGRINELKTKRMYDEAEQLLLHCISLSESSAKTLGISPWYYEQIAEIYRIKKEFAKEVTILERYLRKEKAPGTRRGHLYEKLKDARRLVDSFGAKG